MIHQKILSECQRLGVTSSPTMLYASIAEKKLYLLKDQSVKKEYVISTSEKKPSCTENSLGTPWGLHRIAQKIGDGQPLGMTFKARKPTGQLYSHYQKPRGHKNCISTRILWLEGLEAGLNKGPGVDTFNRYIYIHSTDREHLIGTPISSGCILLTNQHMLDLFNETPVNSILLINRT